VLQQAIEKVGLDKAKVINEINTGTFDTIIGKIKAAGQPLQGRLGGRPWQGDNFYGIAPKQDGARAPIVPKPAWQ
jgi:branched-chain amino acid transport system substrate-binding protein